MNWPCGLRLPRKNLLHPADRSSEYPRVLGGHQTCGMADPGPHRGRSRERAEGRGEGGVGDNIFLGNRNGVRTPMQWSSDKNAGFSRGKTIQEIRFQLNRRPLRLDVPLRGILRLLGEPI